MSPERLQHLLSLVSLYIDRKHCKSQIPFSACEHLVITLCYLATRDSQQSQLYNFHVGESTIFNIVCSTFDGIWKAMSHICLKSPNTTDYWLKISNNFETEWNFPNCLGDLHCEHN